MLNHQYLKVLAITTAWMASSMLAPALAQTTLSGVKFDQEITIAGQKLQLNGAGVRYKVFFKVYAAGLYTPTKVTKNQEVLRPIAKRLQMVALRDVSGNEFAKLFTRAMEDNATKEEFGKSINSVLRMGQVFSEVRNVAKGEVLYIDFVPGSGMTVSHKGQQIGDAFKEPEFHSLMMKIWFGPKPADEALRKALLGEQTTANTNVN